MAPLLRFPTAGTYPMTTETRRPSLLVVDDDDTREALAELLRDEGYAVATARDGEQAHERVKAHLPDLVLLDIVMPRPPASSCWARYASAGRRPSCR